MYRQIVWACAQTYVWSNITMCMTMSMDTSMVIWTGVCVSLCMVIYTNMCAYVCMPSAQFVPGGGDTSTLESSDSGVPDGPFPEVYEYTHAHECAITDIYTRFYTYVCTHV